MLSIIKAKIQKASSSLYKSLSRISSYDSSITDVHDYGLLNGCLDNYDILVFFRVYLFFFKLNQSFSL